MNFVRKGLSLLSRIFLQAMRRDAHRDSFQVDLTGLEFNPHCPHGPMILFHRHSTKKPAVVTESYYACSAYRESKRCRLRLPYNKTGNGKKSDIHAKLNCPTTSPVASQTLDMSKKAAKRRFDAIEDDTAMTVAQEGWFCDHCGSLLDKQEVGSHKHKNVRKVDTRFPSRFLPPLDEERGEAQYFFGDKSLKCLLDILKAGKDRRVLYIGCPRLYEEASSDGAIMSNYLLDIDGRFERYFAADQFAQYNMFNHHFHTTSGKENYMSFMNKGDLKDLLIVMDPPFAGRVEVLANNLRRVFADIGGECSVIWVFPYFLEKHVVREFPNFQMLDYKIEYDNHTKFKAQKASSSSTASTNKRGSPVRLFTNMDPAMIQHPLEEGYWFCTDCRRFSASENKHCFRCQTCPSTDGKSWRHCEVCSRCVKSDYTHCAKCGRCHAEKCLQQ